MSAPPPESLHTALAALARTQGAAAALLASGRPPLSFANLLARTSEIGASLSELGIGRGDCVASALPGGADTAVLYFGVACCATYAPLNPEYTEDEFGRYLAMLRPAALIVPAKGGEAARAAARRLRLPLIELALAPGTVGSFELRCNATRDGVDPQWASADDVALILLTSGTTARPKLVPMRHRNLTAMAAAGRKHYGLGSADRSLHTMPMFHGHGLKSGLTLPVLAGSGTVCAEAFDVPSFFEHLATMGVTWYSAGYTMQHAILDRIRDFRGVAAEANLRFVVSGAGRTDPKVVDGLEAAFGVPLLDRYSTSETCMLASEPVPPQRRKRGTVGVPVLNELRIANARGETVARGEQGEILARGPGVFDGYQDAPRETAEAFIDGWFRTGDVGWMDDDGFLTISGRVKELINRGGEKIAPLEVERVLALHPAVAEVCVFGQRHPTLGEDVAAAVVRASGTECDERAIIEFAQGRLAAFKVPRRIRFTGEFPRLPSGKTDRAALAKACAQDASHNAKGPPQPGSPIETEVGALWRELGVDAARNDLDFFVAGGDSLKAAELVVALEQRFGVSVSMKGVFDEGATIGGLARLIERARDAPDDPSRLPAGMLALKRDGDRRPLFAVPGTDGNASSWVHFCRVVDPRQPLYGLQSRGLDGRAEPLARLEDIAQDHVARVRAVQPNGPYLLIGACFGARVAYEMARQLEAAGERVDFLAMLDPSPPFTDSRGRPRGGTTQRADTRKGLRVLRFIGRRVRLYASELARLDAAGRWVFVKEKARMALGIVASRDLFRGDPSELHRVAVYEANLKAGHRYVPPPYAGEAIIALCEGRPIHGARNYRLDWLELAPRCGAPRLVPGRDTGDMLVPPSVYALAKHVNAWLERAHEGSSHRALLETAARASTAAARPSAPSAGERA